MSNAVAYNVVTDKYYRLDDGRDANAKEVGEYLAGRIAMYVAHNLDWRLDMFSKGNEPAVIYWTRKALPEAVKACPW